MQMENADTQPAPDFEQFNLNQSIAACFKYINCHLQEKKNTKNEQKQKWSWKKF